MRIRTLSLCLFLLIIMLTVACTEPATVTQQPDENWTEISAVRDRTTRMLPYTWTLDKYPEAETFKAHMDKWITRFRETKPVDGQPRVLIPGDPEHELAAHRRTAGIPLLEPVVQDLQGLAAKFGLEF